MLLRLLPPDGAAALDVGSGDGAFAALLARRYSAVVALDADPAQVLAARARCADVPNLVVQHADFLRSGLPSGHFDVVTALASLHHMPVTDAVEEQVRVLSREDGCSSSGSGPTGTTITDLVLNLAAAAFDRLLRHHRGPAVKTAPATCGRTSWRAARLAATEQLPGARLRRHLLWRCTLAWDKPEGTPWRPSPPR